MSAQAWDSLLETNIVDWDGFDDPSLLMTREEFERRAMQATRMIKNPDLASYAESHPNAGTPEVTPLAREVAEKEVQSFTCALWTQDTPPGLHVQRALDAARSQAIDELSAATVPEIGAALAVKDAEVARLTQELTEEREKHGRAQMNLRQWRENCGKLDAQLRIAKDQLSTERAAREKAEMAYGNWKSIRHRDMEIEKSLRTQLASVTSERDEWANKASLRAGECSSLQNERAVLQRMLAAAEKEREAYMLRSVGAMNIAEGEPGHERIPRDCPTLMAVSELRQERDTLAQRVAELKKELNEAHAFSRCERDKFKIITSQRDAQWQLMEGKLSDQLEELKRVKEDADIFRAEWNKALVEAGENREAKEQMHDQRDGARCQRDELKARCEKLEKALEKAAANFRGYGFHATAEATLEALNQSPE